MGDGNPILVENLDYNHIKSAIVDEISKAANKQSSSLKYIKHTLPKEPLIQSGITQGLVIGGTNYIAKTVQIKDSVHIKAFDSKVGSLPIFATRNDLIDFLKLHLDSRAEAIGVNFGFTLKPTKSKEGYMDGFVRSQGTKGHTFIGVDETIGTIVRDTFKKQFGRDIPVVVANDVISIMLSGSKRCNASIIVGTGCNAGLRIATDFGDELINLEAGGLNTFPKPNSLKAIDLQSKNPGKKLWEKMMSGKYLVEHFNYLIQEHNIQTPALQTSLELSAAAHKSDNKIAQELARKLIERSARMTAALIAAMYTYVDCPENFDTFGDGSVFWNAWNFQQIVKNQLKMFEIPEKNIKIKRIEDIGITGALGLLTQ